MSEEIPLEVDAAVLDAILEAFQENRLHLHDEGEHQFTETAMCAAYLCRQASEHADRYDRFAGFGLGEIPDPPAVR